MLQARLRLSPSQIFFGSARLSWSLGNGGVVIAEVCRVTEAVHVTEVSGLKFCNVRIAILFRMLQLQCSILKNRMSSRVGVLSLLRAARYAESNRPGM